MAKQKTNFIVLGEDNRVIAVAETFEDAKVSAYDECTIIEAVNSWDVGFTHTFEKTSDLHDIL